MLLNLPSLVSACSMQGLNQTLGSDRTGTCGLKPSGLQVDCFSSSTTHSVKKLGRESWLPFCKTMFRGKYINTLKNE